MRGERLFSQQALEAIREMAGSEGVFEELIEMFIADSKERISAIERSLQTQDARALAHEAHALKGSCANFGAERLESLCRQLQDMGQRGDIHGARALLPEVQNELRQLLDALRDQKETRDIWGADRRGR